MNAGERAVGFQFDKYLEYLSFLSSPSATFVTIFIYHFIFFRSGKKNLLNINLLTDEQSKLLFIQWFFMDSE